MSEQSNFMQAGPTACVPTKRRWKKVSMQLKTQYLGRDVREKMRELVLEEHESCECRCRVVAAKQCTRPGTDNDTDYLSRFI